LLREERETAERQRHEERETADRQRHEMETKLEVSEAKLRAQEAGEMLREQALEAKLLPQRAQDAICEQRLETLQWRLQSLHAAELLSDDELFHLEDTRKFA
jgi:hypothetical protein